MATDCPRLARAQADPSAGAAAASPTSHLAQAPRYLAARHHDRSGVAGSGVVPSRSSRCASRALLPHVHAAMGLSHVRLFKTTRTAARRWQETGISLSRAVLGWGPGVGTAAKLVGQAFALSTSASFERLWTRFVSFSTGAQRSPLPATPATICAYLVVVGVCLRLLDSPWSR
jgi:hypothetical protein